MRKPNPSWRESRTRRPRSRRHGVRRPNSAGLLPVKSASRPKTCDRLPKASPRRWRPRFAFPVHLARRTAETARENVKSSLNTAAQGFQSLTEQFAYLTGLAEAEELARRSFANLQAVSDSSSVMVRGEKPRKCGLLSPRGVWQR